MTSWAASSGFSKTEAPRTTSTKNVIRGLADSEDFSPEPHKSISRTRRGTAALVLDTHQRNTAPMLASPRCGADSLRHALPVSCCGGQKKVPHAWRSEGVRRAAGQ
jgi:hypothetical protein